MPPIPRADNFLLMDISLRRSSRVSRERRSWSLRIIRKTIRRLIKRPFARILVPLVHTYKRNCEERMALFRAILTKSRGDFSVRVWKALHSARWNFAEVTIETRSSNGLESSPRKRCSNRFAKSVFLVCLSLSLFLLLPFFRSLSREIPLYPFFHGSSHVTNESERTSLRIGHGELRTEIPSYGVTDREWSRITWGRVSSWEARKL